MARRAVFAIVLFGLGVWVGMRLERVDRSALTSTFGGYVSEWGSPVRPLPVGSPAPDFDLRGVDGRRYSLGSFGEAEILVVVFTCNHCPTAQAYEQRLADIARDYAEQNVVVVAITSNDPEAVRLDELGYSDLGDSFEETRQRAAERGFPFPYLYDGDEQRAAKTYGALATPHVFVFDRERILRYAGRVDDSDDPRRTRRHELRAALDSLLAEEPVEVAQTRVFGCSIKWADKRDGVAAADRAWGARAVEVSPADGDDIERVARNETDRWRLVNVWATWCVPCVEELPALVEIQRMYGGRPFEVITISIDEPENHAGVREMLERFQVALENHHFQADDVDDLAEALDPAYPGAVPYTVLIAPGGQIVYRQSGPFDPAVLKRVIVDKLGRTYFS